MPNLKSVFRWALRLFLAVLVLGVVLVLLKDELLRAVAERRIREQTGLHVEIGKLQARLLTPTLAIEDFKLFNSPEFGNSSFVDLPSFDLEYDTSALASGVFHVKSMRVNLREVNIVEDERGRTNLEKIQNQLEHIAQKPTGGGEPRQVAFGGIDLLTVSIGKVNYISLKDPRQSRVFNISLTNEMVTNVHSEADLSGVIAKGLVRAWYLRAVPGSSPTNRPKVN